MRFVFLAILAVYISLVSFSSPATAGYNADNCQGTTNRVRADLIFDLKSGDVLFEKNANALFHPASLTKLVSLMVIFDALRAGEIDYSDRIQLVRARGQIDGRTASIKSMTVKEAIQGVATGSLNNALDGVAIKIGMETFVRRMNHKSKSLGLTHTKFVNTTGWPTSSSKSQQRTTLHELAKLLRYLETEYEHEYSQFDGKAKVYINGLAKPLSATNNLLQNASSRRANPYKGVVGGKTGYTCYSGWHLITLYKDPSKPDDRLVVMSVGHATGISRDQHVRTLLDENIDKYKRFKTKSKTESILNKDLPNKGVEIIRSLNH
jgi:D-alanyl-D-alanine carboxypeptidase (penicillin-binding protein 5/6)